MRPNQVYNSRTQTPNSIHMPLYRMPAPIELDVRYDGHFPDLLYPRAASGRDSCLQPT